jgi:hypothetical protein
MVKVKEEEKTIGFPTFFVIKAGISKKLDKYAGIRVMAKGASIRCSELNLSGNIIQYKHPICMKKKKQKTLFSMDFTLFVLLI